MLFKIEYWLQFSTTLTGIFIILIPLLGFRRVQVRGSRSGAAARLLRWPVMLVQTALLLAIGIAFWHPLPIVLSPAVHLRTYP
ncbi:MAG: hypothetical protein PVJ21_09355 [Anaerolineales bacterium]|jgi:hypothetical protein